MKHKKLIGGFLLVIICLVTIIITLNFQNKSPKNVKVKVKVKEKSKSYDSSINDMRSKYKIEKGSLYVTYDNKKTYVNTKLKSDSLFYEDDHSHDLQVGSFYITPEITAFVSGNGNMKVTISEDKGKTFKTYYVGSDILNVRKIFIGFTSKNDGYILITGDKAMSFESKALYLTHDGGKLWSKSGNMENLSTFLVTCSAFSTEKMGFTAFKSTSDGKILLYKTEDEGKTWNPLTLNFPPDYEGTFTIPYFLSFNGSTGKLLIAKEDGVDGKMARFISFDKGLTWKFDMIVDTNY